MRRCRICKGYLREGSKLCDTPTEDGPAASLRTVKGHMTAKNTKPKASCVTKSQKNVHFEMPPHVEQPTTQTDAFRNNIHCWGSATLPPDEDVALRSGKKPARQGMVKLHGLTPNVAMHLTNANNFAQDHLAERVKLAMLVFAADLQPQAQVRDRKCRQAKTTHARLFMA